MFEETRETSKAVETEYASPEVTVIGQVQDLTAGPITINDESPSGMKG
ncbi:MAG TPA: hypothetical protein VHX17_03960 [Candidatus Cybelea sp.]|jgi:hypothetical protein|nr:hypothetical protein [Candidatus Cybelea sp.]